MRMTDNKVVRNDTLISNT